MNKLTIFTPTYNRAHTLPRTYESLCKQKNKDFVWLIIDDGSSDNTEELVKNWQKENSDFTIEYVKKENGGMHTAHNVAYKNIHTELNMCIDSDDCIAENAVEKILNKWDKIREQGYAGIIGLDADFNGKVIGKEFPVDIKETTLSSYYTKGGFGDKKLVYRTDVIQKYPEYPVFDGEKYVALAYLYRLIDQEYSLAVMNEILCNVEYQSDGSSATMLKQYIKNPKGFAFWRKVCMKYPESKKRLIVDNIHYVSSSILSKNRKFVTDSPTRLLTILAIPLGLLLTCYIKIRVRNI